MHKLIVKMQDALNSKGKCNEHSEKCMILT